MRKTLKRAALIAATGAMLTGTAFSASAATSTGNGQWCQESNGWWYKLTEDGKTFLANTWYWIKDTDGVVRCYYFDQNGWLQTGKTIDGSQVDENGRWMVDGKVQENPADKDYATSVDFAKLAQTQTAASASGSTTTASASTTSKTTTTKTTTTSNKTGKKAYKSSGNGDNPANAVFTQGYTNSSISGSSITNSWANFKMTLSGAKVDNSGDGTDVYIDSDTTSNFYITFYPISKYGTATLDGFVKGFLSDARGYKGGSQSNDITLGAFSFKQLTKTVATPEERQLRGLYLST